MKLKTGKVLINKSESFFGKKKGKIDKLLERLR